VSCGCEERRPLAELLPELVPQLVLGLAVLVVAVLVFLIAREATSSAASS